MPLGSQPPPFFKRGLPPVARLTIYLSIAAALLAADLRLRYLETLRQGLAVLTYPVRIAAASPAEFLHNAGDYFSGLVKLQQENARLKETQLNNARELLRYRQLEAENSQLRAALDMRARLSVSSIAAEILFQARDPFSHRVILDKGVDSGVVPGAAVVDAAGMVGQVTRVFPLQSEVTLLSDKDQATPVVVARSGLRAVMFGTGAGYMELRFLAANADVQPGDMVLTSGLDGVFVPGLPVAVVVRADRESGESFAHIVCRPIGGVAKAGPVLVLSRAEPAEPPPPPEAGDARSAAGRIGRKAGASHPEGE